MARKKVNALVQGLLQEDNVTSTTNGMKANKSTLNACLDLFSKIGSSRQADISGDFAKALKENEDTAVRILLWARDVREGAGERETFRKLLIQALDCIPVEDNYEVITATFVNKVVELGRWDDLLTLIDTPYEYSALWKIAEGLASGDGLCAKWMPRQGPIANKIRKFCQFKTPKAYRQRLVSLTRVVETQMCNKQWDDINFGHVPSVAAKNYSKAFWRNAPEAYGKYVADLKTGKAKINAGAIFPHDIVKAARNNYNPVFDEQWKSLPDYCKDSKEFIIPVVDTSGSMTTLVSEGTRAIDVSVSLGLYLAERLKGAFNGKFITFSSKPKIQSVTGSTLTDKIRNLDSAAWEMNTNIEKVFDLILNTSVSNKVPKKDMPTKILILSDMQFDHATDDDETAFELIDSKYKEAGYKRPTLVFWNIAGAVNNHPAKATDKNVGLVSGFSPSILKSILAAKTYTPVDLMLETVNKPRYNFR